MEPTALEFFRRVLETPSPSGYEGRIQQLVREHVGRFADDVTTDVHGNVMAVVNRDAPRRVMLAGHCDQIGLVVQYIDAEGFVYVQAIGGWDVQMLVGQRMTVWTDRGPVAGVIGRKPIHLLTEDERKQVPKLKDLWLDIGAANRDEAEKLVRVGDPVTVELGYRELRNGRAASPAMDDKCGMWVVLEALRRIDRARLCWAVYAVSTVQEEVGLRGARTSAFGIDPHVGVAVDVTHATDCPTIEKKEEGDIALGRGPVVYRGPNMNPKVVQRLLDVARDRKIAIQVAASGKATGTDANSIQVNRAGVATGLVSIPNRYMHSPVEMIALDDLDHAADLLAGFCESLGPDDDFVP
ncbi:MAG: M42 family metallopeptidase [Thermoguttaceae bacterium]|jgi:endoglucanase|nr:M42 family metallopeptidase [Thermoguttaceae bacterium]